jgi:hypothetical protein
MPWEPEAVDGQGNFYGVVYSSDTTASLARVDKATGKPDKDPIVSTPGFDGFSQLVFDSERGERVLGVRVETDAATTVWFDPEVKKLQEVADARFPNTINAMSCARCWAADGAILIRSYSDRDPGTFSVYRPSTREWTTIGSARPAVDPKAMATLDLHRIKARDGLDLPVWVTTPRGAAERASACSGPRSRRPLGPRRPLALEPGRAVSRIPGLCRHRARVSRQHRLRQGAHGGRDFANGERRCRTTSAMPCAGRPRKD